MKAVFLTFVGIGMLCASSAFAIYSPDPEPPTPPSKPEPTREAPAPEKSQGECPHDEIRINGRWKCEAPRLNRGRPVSNQIVAPKGESKGD